MFSGEHLRICHPGFTCCTQQMEHKLNAKSGQEFDRIMAEKISILRNTFISRTAKFDGESSVVTVTICNVCVHYGARNYIFLTRLNKYRLIKLGFSLSLASWRQAFAHPSGLLFDPPRQVCHTNLSRQWTSNPLAYWERVHNSTCVSYSIVALLCMFSSMVMSFLRLVHLLMNAVLLLVWHCCLQFVHWTVHPVAVWF